MASNEQLESLGSKESLNIIADDERRNRNSNMTMVPQTTTDLGPSPLSNIVDMSGSKAPSTNNSSDKARGVFSRFFNSELGRFLVSIVYFAVICIFMAFCNQFSDHRWIKTSYQDVLLEDRGFDIFPAQKDITPANIFVMTSVVFTLIGMALICPTWTARLIVLRRVMWVVGTLSVYRALTLSVTTLPTPKKGCSPATKTGFWDMFWIALQMIPGTVQACTDDIFSGHTTFMVTCAIQWRLYCKNKWVTYFSYCYITVGLYFVVATRLHYTVDVVLAIFITYAVWSLYIAMIDVVMEKEYFGLQRQNEKYLVFGDSASLKDIDTEETITTAKDTSFAGQRARLNKRMNRMRGAGIGYDRSEHDRVAFVPMQYNTWLTGAVRWCDGLDLRMRQSSSGTGDCTRWEELIITHRSLNASSSSNTHSHKGHDNQASHDDTPVMLESVRVASHDEIPASKAQ
ncbi:hypothetical protein BG006_008296 [Podila minutissima]|uniref:Sphingomyelin synthase-like domain-containing protein n=1 Tax=Podila minutissima TaxID=64525 RepID=A0A9P5VK99_9FUNG|nr:hypothetical protein BG006_008296 [Podila minutissima]